MPLTHSLFSLLGSRGAPAVRDASVATQSGANTHSAPSGRVVGDLLVFYLALGSTTLTGDADWTTKDTQAASGSRHIWATRTADGTSTDNYTWTGTGLTFPGFSAMYAFSNATGYTLTAGTTHLLNSTNIVVPSVTVPATGFEFIMAATHAFSGSGQALTTPAGYTIARTDSLVGDIHNVYSKAAVAGATGTTAITASGSGSVDLSLGFRFSLT